MTDIWISSIGDTITIELKKTNVTFASYILRQPNIDVMYRAGMNACMCVIA